MADSQANSSPFAITDDDIEDDDENDEVATGPYARKASKPTRLPKSASKM